MTSTDGVDNGFYVQSQGGGAWSGIYIYRKDGFGSYSAQVGDVLTIKGGITEFYDATQLVVSKVEDVTDLGQTAELSVDSMDPSAVSDWEQWESCLVSIGATTATSDVDHYGEIETDKGLNIDNLFYNFPSENGQSWSDVSGVIGYSFNAFKIWPRFEADMLD